MRRPVTRSEIAGRIEALGREIISLEVAQQQERTDERREEIVARKAARAVYCAELAALPSDEA